MAAGGSDNQTVGFIVAAFAVVVVTFQLWLFCSILWPRAPKLFLEKKRKRGEILDIVELSHDVKRFRISLGGKGTMLGLPTGKHVKIYAPNVEGTVPGKWNGRDDGEHGRTEIERNYTPVSSDETTGHVDLIVKMYRAGRVKMAEGKDVMWEDGGKMTRHLDSKKAGDFLEIFGPVGIHEYLGSGTLKVPGRTVTARHIGMMAGGAGITPMLQMLAHALRDSSDKTSFTLLYANKTEDDILCREQLDELAMKHGDRFRLAYTLDFASAGWPHKQGFITQDMIAELFPLPSEKPIFCLCGPPPMIEFACKKNLSALGYPKETFFAW